MSRDRFQVVEELDPASIKTVSELQRNHYLALGYRPYLMSNGKIKWLTEANRVYRSAKASHHVPLRPVKFASGSRRRKRRHGSRILSFLRENWLFILIVLVILAMIVFMMR